MLSKQCNYFNAFAIINTRLISGLKVGNDIFLHEIYLHFRFAVQLFSASFVIYIISHFKINHLVLITIFKQIKDFEFYIY